MRRLFRNRPLNLTKKARAEATSLNRAIPEDSKTMTSPRTLYDKI